jgi:hypothetical protein
MGAMHLDAAALITLTIFVAGVIYKAGELSARVRSLEKANTEFKGTLEGFFRRIEHMTPRRPRE